MTTEEGNKLIAEFDGWTFENRDEFNRPSKLLFARKATPYTILLLENLEYHSSWDWLMPVVEKLHEGVGWMDGGADVTIHYKNCHIEYMDEDVEYDESAQGETKIEAVWQAVVQFIQWYNNQKSKP
jgi:hypothetical protein